MKRLAALFMLAAVPAHASPYLCTTTPANDTLDQLQRDHGEVPILQMRVGELPAILVANPEGQWVLFVRMEDGKACILGIGKEMKKASSPTQRFAQEQNP